jgi:hypothetical protein
MVLKSLKTASILVLLLNTFSANGNPENATQNPPNQIIDESGKPGSNLRSRFKFPDATKRFVLIHSPPNSRAEPPRVEISEVTGIVKDYANNVIDLRLAGNPPKQIKTHGRVVQFESQIDLANAIRTLPDNKSIRFSQPTMNLITKDPKLLFEIYSALMDKHGYSVLPFEKMALNSLMQNATDQQRARFNLPEVRSSMLRAYLTGPHSEKFPVSQQNLIEIYKRTTEVFGVGVGINELSPEQLKLLRFRNKIQVVMTKMNEDSRAGRYIDAGIDEMKRLHREYGFPTAHSRNSSVNTRGWAITLDFEDTMKEIKLRLKKGATAASLALSPHRRPVKPVIR